MKMAKVEREMDIAYIEQLCGAEIEFWVTGDW
jgi:hypothetical protein